MLVVHHLNNSRSQRVLWLLEELGVAYDLRRYQRDPVTNLAPPELADVHPLGKSPMIEADGRLIVESGAIVENLCARHGTHMVPPADSDAFTSHLELMHFAEGSVMTLSVPPIDGVARFTAERPRWSWMLVEASPRPSQFDQ